MYSYLYLCVCLFVFVSVTPWQPDSGLCCRAHQCWRRVSRHQVFSATCPRYMYFHIHIYTFIETQKYIFIHCIEICLEINMWTSTSRTSMYTNTKCKGCHKKWRYLSNCTLSLCVLFLFQDWNYIFRNLLPPCEHNNDTYLSNTNIMLTYAFTDTAFTEKY